MKTCSLYGFISALAGALLALALYFTGFHSDPAKLPAAKAIGLCAGLAIVITCLVLGVKARRAEIPEDRGLDTEARSGPGCWSWPSRRS
jgi:hypothetical protein